MQETRFPLFLLRRFIGPYLSHKIEKEIRADEYHTAFLLYLRNPIRFTFDATKTDLWENMDLVCFFFHIHRFRPRFRFQSLHSNDNRSTLNFLNDCRFE